MVHWLPPSLLSLRLLIFIMPSVLGLVYFLMDLLSYSLGSPLLFCFSCTSFASFPLDAVLFRVLITASGGRDHSQKDRFLVSDFQIFCVYLSIFSLSFLIEFAATPLVSFFSSSLLPLPCFTFCKIVLCLLSMMTLYFASRLLASFNPPPESTLPIN